MLRLSLAFYNLGPDGLQFLFQPTNRRLLLGQLVIDSLQFPAKGIRPLIALGKPFQFAADAWDGPIGKETGNLFTVCLPQLFCFLKG